ncbi:uncharacterized protein [Nerophis lumbriciformis]|uniref:uncharacterized protein n=1 Tax=Nerophis lumbriciformis TaxID=546530 RepID=UPI003BAD8327
MSVMVLTQMWRWAGLLHHVVRPQGWPSCDQSWLQWAWSDVELGSTLPASPLFSSPLFSSPLLSSALLSSLLCVAMARPQLPWTFFFFFWKPFHTQHLCLDWSLQCLRLEVSPESGEDGGKDHQDSSSSYPGDGKKCCLTRAQKICKDSSHPHQGQFSLLDSRKRFRSLRSRTSSFCSSFFPQADLKVSSGHRREASEETI